MAAGLGLHHHIPHIAGEISKIRVSPHWVRLGRVLQAWREETPDSFTLDTLITLLSSLQLRQAELWVRILAAPLYQHSSFSSSSRLSRSHSSLTAGQLNVSQDSGVTDLASSVSSEVGERREWRNSSHSLYSSGSRVSRGVFDILFKPEGKALTRLSQAWIERMKEKKRRRKRNPCISKSTERLISVEKYFDNLVSILYHSTSTLSTQSI